MKHKEATYFDNYRHVKYCRICGKEDMELIATECVPIEEKPIDNPKPSD